MLECKFGVAELMAKYLGMVEKLHEYVISYGLA